MEDKPQDPGVKAPTGVLTVWKFPVNVEDATQVLRLPVVHHILSVGLDPAYPEIRDGRLALWALIEDPGEDGWLIDPARHTEIPISVFGTGAELPPSGDMTFIGTAIVGPGVWHVFRDHGREENPPLVDEDAVRVGAEGEPDPFVARRAQRCTCGHQRQAHPEGGRCEYTNEAEQCSCQGFEAQV